VEPVNAHAVVWVSGHTGDPDQLKGLDYTCLQALDRDGRPVILFPSAWARQYAQKENPGVTLADEPRA
jgi:peptide subunit release factor RF-3